jgi:DNA-binding LacI/PurR family transcriptional regulator
LKEIRDLSEEASDFWYILLKGIMEVTSSKGYAFNFESGTWEANDSENLIIKKARGKSVDGAIIIPQYNFHYEFLKPLMDINFPFVIINPTVPLEDEEKVVIKEFEAARTATNYLIDKGFERIGFINGPENHADSITRHKGFIEALINHKKTIYSELIVNSDFTIAGGMTATDLLLEQKEPPQAIFCANDYIAVGAIHRITSRGLKVPHDISVFGYGDHDVGRCVLPQLTTMRTPVLEVGRAAANKLFNQINNEEDLEVQTEFLPTLVERESVKNN